MVKQYHTRMLHIEGETKENRAQQFIPFQTIDENFLSAIVKVKISSDLFFSQTNHNEFDLYM